VLCGVTARWESPISLSIWELLAEHLNDARAIVRDESKVKFAGLILFVTVASTQIALYNIK
jgi:hypothetical protein